MKCETCGYDLTKENEYCPNCGTKVEVKEDKIECFYCHYKMEPGSNYCPKCGKSVNENTCECGQVLKSEDIFCYSCGKTVEQENTQATGGYVPIGKTKAVKQKPVVKKENIDFQTMNKGLVERVEEDNPAIWKNPILWIISISLLVVCILLSQYMASTPSKKNNTPKTEDKIPDEDLVELKITGENTLPIKQSNINAGGYSYVYDDRLYLGYDGAIYEMELDFSNSKKVIDEYGEYIYVDTEYIYYCNVNNEYLRVNKETKKEEKLLENIYYPQVIEAVVYYQADSDGESIHSFNLETKEDKKINNEPSYTITVDVANQSIYYITVNQELYKMNLDGTDSKIVVAKVKDYVLEDTIIYYIGDSGLGKADITNLEITAISSEETGDYLSLLANRLVYGGYYKGVYVIDKDGKNKQVVTTNSISNLEVQGDLVIYTDMRKNTMYGANEKAKRTLIKEVEQPSVYYKEELNVPDIEGIEDF